MGGNALRTINKRERGNVFNILRSIYEDSLLVRELRGKLGGGGLPLLANLRCGAWYSSHFDAECYFKSTDGHTARWDFSFTRLNAHVARLACERGGALIVDSTKSLVKKFPDALSKTVPIWCAVLNRAVELLRTSGAALAPAADNSHWDSDLHLPAWIPENERVRIEPLIDSWAAKLVSAQPELVSELSLKLGPKPLRPLWVSDRSVIWSQSEPSFLEGEEEREEVEQGGSESGGRECWELASLAFVPIYLLSVSKAEEHPTKLSCDAFQRHGWRYIHGAADDHESWARGLTPHLF